MTCREILKTSLDLGYREMEGEVTIRASCLFLADHKLSETLAFCEIRKLTVAIRDTLEVGLSSEVSCITH